jgi:hypothetical protein
MMQAEFAAAILDPERLPPAGVSAWNGSDPARRFAVYRNNVVVTLSEALGATFPAVRRLVGDEFFAATAGVFVREHPPSSPVLAEYGAGFGDFLAQFPPAAELAYLADVARLEFAMLEAYHAADAVPAAAGELADVPPERLGEVRLDLHPSLRLLRSRYAVVTLVAANRATAEPGPIDAGHAEDALVIRRDLEVTLVRLAPGAAAFLESLRARESLGAALAAGSADASEFQPSAAIMMLFELGLVARLRVGNTSP